MAPATATTISHQVSKFTLQTNSQYIRQMNHLDLIIIIIIICCLVVAII